MSRLRAVLFACAVLAAGTAAGASPDPKDLAVPPEDLSKARELVRRMGSESYRDREDAQTELAKMGRRARQALVEAAVGEADPEIRSRAVRLLPRSEADELKARIDTFLADADGKFEHGLPGLKTFTAALGGGAKPRELYVEILKSPYNLEVLAAMDRGPADGGRAVSDRRNALFTDMIQRNVVGRGTQPTQPKQPTLADVAVVLFAETHVPHQHIPRSTIQWQQVSGVMLLNQSSAAVTALNANGGGPHAEVFRAVVGKWLATREDPADLAQLVYQLGQPNFKQFPESLVLLRRIALLDGVQGYAKGYALNYLVQHRGKDEVPFLRAVVRNEVRVGDYPEGFKKGRNPDDVAAAGADAMVTQMWFQNPAGGAGVAHTVTVRDVAFAHLLVQSGLSMRDFGFDPPPNQPVNAMLPANFGQYAFTSDEKRHAGYVKFGWWQMKEGIKKRGILLPHFRDK